MIVVRNLSNIKEELQNSSLTLGNFDGLHLGHKEILNFSKNLALKTNSKSALLTFEPHPRYFFNKESPKKNVRIYSLAQKLEILRNENLVDIVFLLHFNQDLASLKATDFVKKILSEKIKVKNITIGYDFNFGKNRLGNAELLQELAPLYGYNFHQITAKKIDENICSSTNIRTLIEKGEIKEAAKMLGRNFYIGGTIIEGSQNGRKIGFKTANILPKSHMIFPKFGVYQSLSEIDGKKYSSITNFGVKPTFEGQKALFETHIFDFEKEIYGKKMKVELFNFLRPEIKFNNMAELQLQIQNDVKICRATK